MKTARVIPCLDVTEGRVVKGTNFVDLRDAGDPVELAARYDLAARARPFTLCLRCNLPLQTVDKGQVSAIVPPQVLEHQSLFSRCAGCARVYWPGSHYVRMRAALGELLGG